MLLTNWLNTLTSRIRKRRVFRSRDRRDIRKRWQSIVHNQISTTEALEDRTLLTTFFVDDDYTGASDFTGTDTDPVTGGDQNAVFGFTAFTTIQQAVSAAVAGDTIIVAAGTYTEDVLVNTSVILQGANAGIAAGVDPGVRGPESELTGGFSLFANDVVIDGLKIIEGTGPAGVGDKTAVFMAAGTTGHTIENNILEGPGTGVASRGVLSTFNGNNDNVTIQNNEIYNWVAGIHNQGNTNVDIFGNNIHDVVAGVANDFVTDVSIEGNAFSNSLEGIGVNTISDGTPDVAAHDNSFDSLTITNLIAHYGGDTVDASGNWWGITDETTIANSMKSDGFDGNASKVDFTSYLNSGTDTDGGTAGFQGDFSVVNVTALGAQTGPVGRIQEAIDLATSGATINIAAGTYAEDVLVNTSVIIQGANAGIAAGVDPGVRGPESELTGGFSLFANDVVVDGLKIVEGTGPAGVGDKTAVFMTAGTTGHTIENNILVGPGIGVASRAVLSTFNGNNDNITIQNNEIYNWFGGIFNQGNTNVDIFGNNIHDMFAGVSNDFVADVRIEGNAFSNLVEGVGVFNNISNGIPDVAAHNNSFDSSTLTNPIAHYGGDTVDASGNWWGSTDATTIANSMMSNGVDGNVSKIDFTSFLNDGADTVVGLAGFQGNFSVVNVTTLGEQTGLTGRIQEAIDSVAYGATINILAGTYTGNVDATGINITLAPGNSPGQVVINGDLILNGDDTLDIEINGTTAGSGFDQFVVNGDVTLNGATLNLIDGYTPDVAESFILIENNGPNPVGGTFNGYPEGYVFTDFLGVGGLSAYLTYAGGDGNDVAIYTEIPAPVVDIPTDGGADEYVMQIIGGNVVITEVGSGNVVSNTPLAALEGTLVINGEAGVDDTLTIDMTGIDQTTDLQIIFNGGTGGFDTLELVNGNLDSMEFRYVDPSSGSIRLNGSGSDFISYTGLEPVTSTVNATNVTLTYTGGAEIIDISDLGGGQTRVNSSLGEMTDFFNPTGTLTINAGTGADTININSLAAGYTANIIINGGDETDTINVDSSVSLAAGKTIQFNAEVVELTGDVTADAITGSATTVNITGSAGGAEIQDAIDLAASGATINVAAGTYAEDLIVDRSVILQGANAGIAGNGVRGAESLIDPSSPFGIEVRADNVTIDGFEITGLDRDGINVRPTNSGPGVSTRGNIVIQNNYIHETFVPGNQVNGIVFGEQVVGGPDSTDMATISFVTISNNLIDVTDDNTARGIVMTGHFASIHYDNFDITGNVLQAKNNGIFFAEDPAIYTADGIEILGNTFESPGSLGINAGNLDSTSKVNGNTFINNASGAALNFAEPGGEVLNNTFENHTNVGLYFYDATYFPQSSENPTVTGNIFTNNSRQVGGSAPAVDLDAIQNNNSLDGNVKVSSNSNLYGHIQDAIDAAMPGDVVTVVLNATYTENVDVNQAVTLMGEATVDGSVTASVAGATIAPGFSPGIFTSTDLILTAGSLLNVEIDGNSGVGVTGGHDQFVTTGNVNLGGAILDTTGSDIVGAMLGDTFEIIDVSGTLTGTFAGLDNGDTVLVNGQTFRIFYNGGDGNDVVLTFLPPVPVTYVDTTFTGVNGTFITDADPNQGGDQNAVIGVNAFNTIQGGIDGVVAAGTVIVNAGTYAENITLSKQVDLLGVQAGVDARGRVGTLDDSLSSIIAPAGGTGLDLQSGSAGTTIDGFTFSGGTTGIVSTSGPIDDLQILNNQFVGFTGSGVFLNDSGDDITVHQNVVDGTSQIGGGGIFHLDQDTFDGFHFTSNWVLNGDTGFFVDGTRNVSSSASRDPLFEDNLFDGNGAGANFGRFGVENAVVQNNVFSNNAFDGLQGGIQNSLITMNTFDTNARAGLRLTGFGGTGDSTRGAQGNIVEENIFLNNGAGMSGTGYGDVRLDDQFDGTISTNTFFNNSFGSTVAVFNNETSGEVVDFSGNWWATLDDDAVVLKLDGAGALAVDFTSFLNNGTDQNVGLAGFQGDFSTLNVTALGSQTGPAGRIQEAISNVTFGGIVNILSGTYAGNVDATVTGINKNVTLAPGNSPGQVVINGDLILNGDDFLDIEINGQTAGSGYDQFIVNGAVVLNDAALNLTNTYSPVDGDKFTLIDNDAADGITGTFIGYPEGHEFTNFLGSGLNAYLTYVGGDGNDVVIHMVDSTPEITVPNNGTADQYTLSIVGGNFVLSETVSGTIISTFPVAAINGPLVINGEDGEDDTLTIDLDTIDHTTDIQIEFRGGTGGNDALILDRTGLVNSVEHVFASDSDGSILLDGETVATATISYTGLEPVIDNLDANDRIFTFTGAGAEVITLSDDLTPSDDYSFIDSDFLGESVTFLNPNNSLTINTELSGGDGVDTVNIEGVDANFTANLTVNAGNDDTLTTTTVDIGTGIADLNAGIVNINNVFTTTGSVDIDAETTIVFTPAGVIDAGASNIDLTVNNGNIALGQVTTTGDVTLTATAGIPALGIISDINLVVNNITATNATLVSSGDVGFLDALEIAVTALEANAGGLLNVDNTGTLDIGFTGGINGVTVGAASTITSTGTMTVTENITATGGSLQLQNTGGDFLLNALAIISNNSTFEIGIDSAGAVTLADTSTVTSSGTGLVDIDAVNNIALANVTTSGEVQVTTSAGAITDNTASEAALITANTAALRAAAGIGAAGADDIDLEIGAMAAVTTAGDIFLQEPALAAVGNVNGLAGITAAGNINLDIGNSLFIDNNVVAIGAGSTITVNSGNNIGVNGISTIQTNGGAINLLADGNLDLNSGTSIDTTSPAIVTLTADHDNAGGGNFTQFAGSVVDAHGGALNVTATGNVRLADLRSAGGTISVTSTNQGILDNTAGEAALISGGAGTEVELRAATNIGTGISGGANDIDLAVSRVAAVATTGNIVLINTGALELGTVNGLVGLDAGDRVLVTTASPLTVASNVTGAGNVTLTSTDAGGAGENLTINGGGVLVESTGADVILNSGDDFLLTAGGTVRASTTIEINVDPITDGTGATVDLLGNVDATQTTINGGDDADTFNILPTDDSPITVNGGAPTFPGPGDVLNMDFSAISNPLLTLGAAAGSGTFDFPSDTEQTVDYTGIENVNTSTGGYHLVLNMLTSGFQNTVADTIDATVDATDTDLLLDINGGNFFTGAVADILSFTTIGSTDNETLNINENANGVLPFFQGAAPATIPGSNGSHLNASAQTFLNAEFAGAAPFTVDDITIHYDGGLGTDTLNVNFTSDHNTGYFSDTDDGLGSGNIGAATTAGADIDLGLSFARLEGVGINGTATGGLRVDASSTPLTDNITISDDGTPADGISLIDGNMQFTDLLFSGFDDLQVVSGTGAETLDLIGLDSATTLTDVELDADDVNGTDTGNDTIRVRSTPVGTVTNVTVLGGLGNDLIQIFDAGNTVDNIFAAITVFGEDGTDTLTLDDSGDVTGDDTFEVTSTTIEGISSSPGTDVTFTDIDNLNVTGTAGNDTINVNLGASLDLNNVEINGSGGDDTFNLQNSTPAGVDTRLNGDAGLDDFIFLASNVLTGVIDGGADVDTIDYSSYTPAVHVILNAVGTTDGFRGTESTSILETVLSTGFDNIDNLIGSAGVDTLQGPDLSNYWGITSTDEGFIIADRTNLNSGRPTVAGDAIASGAEERLDFTSFQNLIGGSQDDRFDLSDGAGLTGTLDGDSGNDSLDYRDFTTDVTVNLFAGTATNIGSLLAGAGGGDDDNSIENVFGGDGNDNITGDNDNNILGDGLGSDNLDGGGFGAGGGIGAGGSGNGGNDVFLLEPGNAGSADVITDIHGNDTVDFRFASAGITFDVDIINEAQTVFGTSTVTLQQIQPEQPDTNPSFMENVVGSQFDDYIYIDPLSQDGNFPIDGPPVLRSADGQGGTDFLDFDSKGQEVIDTGFSLTADGVGTVQYLNFENVTPFEDNPAFIIDNGDPGFTFTGDWPWYTLSNTYLTTGAGFEDDFYVTDAETPFSTGPAQAYWEFFGLTPGEYRVSVTWPFSENPSAAQFKATDAPFTVYDGTRDEIGSTAIDHGTFDLNQQLEPDDYSADGTTWEILDTFTISSRTLTVMLTNLADGYITADAIRIERVSAGPEIDLVDVTDPMEPPAQIVDGEPDGIQFGPTELLTDAVRTFEITNSGSSDLTISNVLVPAGYETTLTDQVIGSGNTISFTITMGSDTFGDRSGIFSFETDDVDESTFNILLDGQVSNVIIIDDGDADFSATPGFINFPTLENLGSNGYEGDVTGAVPNDPGSTPAPGLETATWTFSGLTNGNYRVSTTWSQYFNRVEDAPYSLNGGSIIEVDQSVAPSSFVEDGVAWFDLSTSFNVTTGELVVTLTNEASSWVRDHWDLANGVIADAVRIEYLPEPDIEITVDGSVVDDDTGVVDFGSTLPGIPVIKEFTITNLSSTDSVDVMGLIEFPPGFSILPTSPFGTDTATVPLAAGASITFSIQFDGGTNGTTFGKVSFTTGDADENPYNFTVRGEAGPATVGINDTNFSTSGTWQEVNPENIGDPLFLYANELYQPGTGANAATWSFDVEPGRYQVVAHWTVDPGVTMNGSGAASNAPYTISDGLSPVIVYVNQQTSSNDFLDDGILWEYIGDPFVVSDPSSTLTVQLTDDADGIVYADQIRIYRVVDPVVKVEVDGGTVEDSGTVNFDDTIVGASVVKTFTVTNYGERNMALSPTINLPAGFSLISGFGSTNLAPGASTTFTLQMDASSAGSFEGMVSFGVDSSDANPFNFTVTGSAANSMIIDNGDLGYTTSGNWIPQSSTIIYDYYEDDQDVLASDNLPSTDTATWDFTNLAAGTYSISSHWGSHSNLSSNAQFLISGILGGDITVSLDQRYAADDFVDGSGVNWEALGTFQVAGGSDLTITLLDNGTPGRLAADAMRLEVLLPGTIDPEIEIEAGAVSLVDSVSNIDLGTAFYGETLSQTFTITNTGTDTLNLSSISLTSASVFGIPVSPDFTIYAGQSTTFTVEFNSTGTAGPETSLLTINSNDSDEGSFEIDLSATMTTTLIIDDGDTGFSSTGDFFATSWLAYYEWDAHQLNTGDTGTATWEFSGLNPGDNFNVYATWSAHGSLATNAEYSINAGGPIVVNQRLAPNDLNSDGANWELLGTVNVTAGGLISVTLSDNAADGRIRADAIRIERTGPLMAAAGVSTSNAPAITQSDLDSVRDAALSYWKSTGLSETQISLLESVSFVLADLPDAMLGAATTTTILIDVNAAGYGWFVDDTPFDNSEFSLDASGELIAGTGSAAYGQMDLLTVMLHEMGHTLGYDHDDDGDSLMSDALDASERHLPEIDDFFSGVADGDNPLLD
ncbi:hypothetical protein Mal35_18290 [Gimesia maris]|uniref:golvesin C-terminal-like domain-containing protein n=1 Tax=Gimesia maris TaxID=122 RepID=UPI0011884AA9|nr:choice-of-anchor D domain-containing protein [Gimesia maris]QDT78380.1 hypothetical protein Mal35_18290 [Gimesia maris]